MNRCVMSCLVVGHPLAGPHRSLGRERTNRTGAWVTFSRPDVGGTYQDPNLSNGGGTSAGGGWGTGSNMQDRFESHDFCY